MKKFLDLIVKNNTLEEIEKDIGFSSNIFMVFGLPARKLEGATFWKDENTVRLLKILDSK